MNRQTRVLMLVVLVMMWTQVSEADDRWPQFRGPGSRGISDESGLPTSWSTPENVAWVTDIPGLGWNSPIIYGDYYYTLLDRGFFTCHDARTGAEIYGQQRIQVGAAFTSSPWAYDGKIFVLSEDGDTYVIRAGPTFEVLGRNSLNEFSMATPAIAHGSLFIRTASKLYPITEHATP